MQTRGPSSLDIIERRALTTRTERASDLKPSLLAGCWWSMKKKKMETAMHISGTYVGTVIRIHLTIPY